MKRVREWTRPMLALVVAAALASSACASAPQERLYVLSSGGSVAAVRAGAGQTGGTDSGRSVVVAPAALPDVVDRPQLVLRTGGNQVTILEQQRWAEPLRAGIARVVAEDLARILGTWRVSTRDDAIQNPDCRVSLDVRRFDTSDSGRAASETLWTVACADRARRTGRSVAEEPLASPLAGAALDAAVAAHGRALDVMSRDIAEALR